MKHLLTVLFGACSAFAQADGCDAIRHAASGTDLSIRATILVTVHGTLFFGDKCPSAGIVLLLPGGESPRVDFRVDRKSIDALRPYTSRRGATKLCGTFQGRLFVKSNFRTTGKVGETIGNGYGFRGGARSAFVLRELSGLLPC